MELVLSEITASSGNMRYNPNGHTLKLLRNFKMRNTAHYIRLLIGFALIMIKGAVGKM
jgi:hypothetical protein